MRRRWRRNPPYYGFLAATKGACENKTLVRRTLAEKIILDAVGEQIQDAEHISYVLRRVEEEIVKQRSDLPDTLKLKEAELAAEQRRLANFLDFIGEGRGSQALVRALVETERRVDQLSEDVDALRRSREKICRPPPVEWIKDRLSHLQEVLEHAPLGRLRCFATSSGRSAPRSSPRTSADPSTAPPRPSTLSP